MKKNLLLSAIIIITFIVSFYGKSTLTNIIPTISSPFLKVSFYYAWWLLPTFLVVGLLFGFKKVLSILGLEKGIVTGFVFAFISVLPMLVSSAIIGTINDDLKFGTLLHHTLAAGFFEEYLFRGFLFGILFRKIKWGFIPASIIGGIIFGLGHIYQGSTIAETTGVFVVTALGAVWFSWLYIEWNNNLWVPIFLHTLMNLSWILFEVSSNALGGTYTNIFRALTIALTIYITIRYHKKRGLRIKQKNLLINH